MALDGALGYEVADLEACQIVPNIVSIDSKIDRIFVGPQNSAFISHDGEFYVCGSNQF
jgi:hypothetical protein